MACNPGTVGLVLICPSHQMKLQFKAVQQSLKGLSIESNKHKHKAENM